MPVVPVTTCEHCKKHIRVPLRPGSPRSGRMRAGMITCGLCGEQTRVKPAFVIEDPNVLPGEVSHRVPARCPKCKHGFWIDMFAPAEEGKGTPLNMSCPKCGEQSIVQHGMYQPIEGGVQFTPVGHVISGQEIDEKEALRLLAFFGRAMKKPAEYVKAVGEEIDKSPALKKLVALAVPTEPGGFYGLVGILLVLIPALRKWVRELRRKGKQTRTPAKPKAKKRAKKSPTKKAKGRSASKSPRKTWKVKKKR